MGLETESNATVTGGAIEEWLPREIAVGARATRASDTSEFIPFVDESSPEPAESVDGSWTQGPDRTEFVGESRMNLNEISFETLRTMNVSVTEAARVVAYRQRRGGVLRSLEEIDAISGLSPALRGWLKSYGAV